VADWCICRSLRWNYSGESVRLFGLVFVLRWLSFVLAQSCGK
jgi:hypothetical protein